MDVKTPLLDVLTMLIMLRFSLVYNYGPDILALNKLLSAKEVIYTPMFIGSDFVSVKSVTKT